ncbi:MAG: HIT domain-containing protein [bacterium]|jgi:bis(5'-nucleosyl)-tetraphosphatase (symmetrical)|nr:HIT domain-containing protein [bacterium]
MNDCLFCKIVKGEIPSYTVYEDEKVKVFLDINPNNDGHLLVIPKEHKTNLYEMNDETLLYMLNIIRTKLVTLLKDKLAIDGLTISQNNDYGQEVKHFHIHVIPRYKNDKFPLKSDCSNVEEIYHKLVD